MEKTLKLLLCLTMVCALSACFLTACAAKATAIEVVSPKTEYFVGEAIDYDNLSVKVTYDDGTQKQGTLKQLNLSVKSNADLSKAGETSYTIGFGALSHTVSLTVAESTAVVEKPAVVQFFAPTFYTNYVAAAAERDAGATETRADFRKTGEIYEVGNVNKFIFRPFADAYDDDDNEITVENAKTTVKVYEKNTEDKYVLIPDTDLDGIVAIEDNTYKFTDEAAGKTFKLEISLDANEYDLSGLSEKYTTITVEFVVVGGGYNVYDQLGLSVMNDLSSKHWAEIWKCDIDANYNLTARTDSLKLEADDKPLCEYVGKIDWVVLHSSFALDADQMPSYYFWNEESEGFETAKLALSAHKEAQNLLVGSLRDGIGNGIHFTVTNVDSDTNRYASQLGFGLNMQKAFFSTYNVSVSGNYNSITAPKTDSEGGRRLFAYLDYEDKTQRDNPVPHWAVFQMYQSKLEGKAKEFTLKNMALTGNGGLVTETSFAPASLNLLCCYSTGVDITNVVANAFYTNVTCDGYDDDNAVNVDSIKFYDAFSNMFYAWRANVKVVNSDLIGSGGPLFILCDGQNSSTNAGGSDLVVDKKSVFEAYATGSESWYKLYNAQALVQQIKSTMEIGAFNNIGKTVRFHKDQNGKYTAHTKDATGAEYVNVIAAIICEPGDLMAGLNNEKLIVRGTFTTVDEDENVVEQFNTRNMYVTNLSTAVGNNGKLFAPVFQTGSLFTYTDGSALYTLGATGQQAFNPATDGVSWFTDAHDKLGIYMSAGSMSGSENAPYFGVVVGSAHYAA